MLNNNSMPRSAVSFRTWTGQRQIGSVGTTAGLNPLAFQRWRSFKEAFAPEIVERAFSESRQHVRHIIDPFGGSGTTALAAQFLGARPTTIEVNPYLADLIEAKLAQYNPDEVGRALAKVCKRVLETDPSPHIFFPGAPETFVEPGIYGQYIFSTEIAARIISYKLAIQSILLPEIRRLFKVLLGSILIPVSNVTISGKGRRYRSSWQNRMVTSSTVDEMFQERVLNALYDIRLYGARACHEYDVLQGDCRKLLDSVGPAELAVFSPPYPNSFDYTDVYNVELWALGYLDCPQKNTALRNATVRSHVQIKRDMTGSKYPSRLLLQSVRALNKVRASLWNLHIPEMIGAYVSDMGDIMVKLAARLTEKGRVYMVVGDSRYAGVSIPVGDILQEIAPSTGFRVLRSEECRSMRVSPQQGGQEELAETLLILEKK